MSVYSLTIPCKILFLLEFKTWFERGKELSILLTHYTCLIIFVTIILRESSTTMFPCNKTMFSENLICKRIILLNRQKKCYRKRGCYVIWRYTCFRIQNTSLPANQSKQKFLINRQILSISDIPFLWFHDFLCPVLSDFFIHRTKEIEELNAMISITALH